MVCQLTRSEQSILSRRQYDRLFSVINMCSAADGRTSGISWRPSFIAKNRAMSLGIALFGGGLNGDIKCVRGICINPYSIDPEQDTKGTDITASSSQQRRLIPT